MKKTRPRELFAFLVAWMGVLLLLETAMAESTAPPRVPPGLNRGYVLDVKPTVRIDARYGVSVSAPAAGAREWVILVPRPPDLPSQRILGADTLPPGTVVLERSALRRPVLRIEIPVTDAAGTSGARAEARTAALLYSRTLRKGTGVSQTPDLSEAERDLYLRRTVKFDRDSPELRKWITGHRLARGHAEGEINHARRVFRHLALNFQYEYLGEQNRSAPHVCTAGKSDCGGLSVLFATVLRSQGVPARILAGRWARSADPGEKIGAVNYRQEHITAEFFAQGVGWVPVDPAGAILHDRSAERLAHFGNDPGLFLTLHVDAELLLDTGRFGIRPMDLMQRASYWARGSGSLKDSVLTEAWTVKRRPAGP
jgi:transglutaminase-like putative cysteine protease